METLEDIKKIDGCFRTYTGIKFNLMEPTPEMIDIKDIARALSHNPHFLGHTPGFFSIAQHCVLVVSLLPGHLYTTNPAIPLMALLHDAGEAYVGDMIKPLKVFMPDFCKIEDKIMEAVCEKFELDPYLMKIIKPYDIQAQEIEYSFFKTGNGLDYLSANDAYQSFLRTFITLNRMHKEILNK